MIWITIGEVDDISTAPTWNKVLPRLKRVMKDRQVLAYNSSYGHGCVLADTRRVGLDPGHLADASRVGVRDDRPLRLGAQLAVAAPRRRPPRAR